MAKPTRMPAPAPAPPVLGLPVPAYTYDYYEVVKEPDKLLPLIDFEPEPGGDPLVARPELTTEQKVFLSHYMGSGSVTTALRKAGMSRQRYQQALGVPLFSRALEAATEAIADTLEQEGLRRALTGSDKMLMEFLKAYRREKFGNNSTINSFIEGKMQVNVTNWAELVVKAAAEIVDVMPEPKLLAEIVDVMPALAPTVDEPATDVEPDTPPGAAASLPRRAAKVRV